MGDTPLGHSHIHELSVHVAYALVKAGKQYDPTVC